MTYTSFRHFLVLQGDQYLCMHVFLGAKERFHPQLIEYFLFVLNRTERL